MFKLNKKCNYSKLNKKMQTKIKTKKQHIKNLNNNNNKKN